MAYRYTIHFNSAGVDESALREAIEHLGISGVSISRARTNGPLHFEAWGDEFQPKTTKTTILDILGDNKPHRKQEILDVLKRTAGITNSAISKALELLVASKQVKKIRHGVYGSLQAVNGPALKVPLKPDSTKSSIVKEIQTGSAMAAQLQEKLGFSHQPIEQILTEAEQQSSTKQFRRSDQRRPETRLRRLKR